MCSTSHCGALMSVLVIKRSTLTYTTIQGQWDIYDSFHKNIKQRNVIIIRNKAGYKYRFLDFNRFSFLRNCFHFINGTLQRTSHPKKLQ